MKPLSSSTTAIVVIAVLLFVSGSDGEISTMDSPMLLTTTTRTIISSQAPSSLSGRDTPKVIVNVCSFNGTEIDFDPSEAASAGGVLLVFPDNADHDCDAFLAGADNLVFHVAIEYFSEGAANLCNVSEQRPTLTTQLVKDAIREGVDEPGHDLLRTDLCTVFESLEKRRMPLPHYFRVKGQQEYKNALGFRVKGVAGGPGFNISLKQSPSPPVEKILQVDRPVVLQCWGGCPGDIPVLTYVDEADREGAVNKMVTETVAATKTYSLLRGIDMGPARGFRRNCSDDAVHPVVAKIFKYRVDDAFNQSGIYAFNFHRGEECEFKIDAGRHFSGSTGITENRLTSEHHNHDFLPNSTVRLESVFTPTEPTVRFTTFQKKPVYSTEKPTSMPRYPPSLPLTVKTTVEPTTNQIIKTTLVETTSTVPLTTTAVPQPTAKSTFRPSANSTVPVTTTVITKPTSLSTFVPSSKRPFRPTFRPTLKPLKKPEVDEKEKKPKSKPKSSFVVRKDDHDDDDNNDDKSTTSAVVDARSPIDGPHHPENSVSGVSAFLVLGIVVAIVLFVVVIAIVKTILIDRRKMRKYSIRDSEAERLGRQSIEDVVAGDPEGGVALGGVTSGSYFDHDEGDYRRSEEDLTMDEIGSRQSSENDLTEDETYHRRPETDLTEVDESSDPLPPIRRSMARLELKVDGLET